MYPSHTPDLSLNRTISNPLDQSEVVGFEARNKTLGRPAVVLKESALTRDPHFKRRVIAVPSPAVKTIQDDGAELVVLLENEALAMSPDDFDVEATPHTFEGGGRADTMCAIRPSSDKFRAFPDGEVKVGN